MNQTGAKHLKNQTHFREDERMEDARKGGVFLPLVFIKGSLLFRRKEIAELANLMKLDCWTRAEVLTHLRLTPADYGMTPRQMGINRRALGLNPRALGLNPRVRKDNDQNLC